MVKEPEPELVSETLCVVVDPTVTLPKLSEAEPKESAGEPVTWAAEPPVPLRGMVTVGSLALLEMVSIPEFTPAIEGTNVVANLWLSPGPRVIGSLMPEI